MSVCVWAAGKSLFCLAGCAFSLAWTHSVEKTEWVEHWAVVGHEMHQTQARVKGFGAGMEPGPNARLENSWWVWEPEPPLRLMALYLAASGATGAGWHVCAEGGVDGVHRGCVNLFKFERMNEGSLVLMPKKEDIASCR